MKQKNIVVLLLSISFLVSHSAGNATEDKDKPSFFGIKKFVKKDAPANPPKKTVKGIPAHVPDKAVVSKANDSELTEDEKRLVRAISEKSSQSEEAARLKKNIKLPPNPLRILQWKAPAMHPKPQVYVPKNPNDSIIRVPQPPARVPLNPNESKQVTVVPASGKKP